MHQTTHRSTALPRLLALLAAALLSLAGARAAEPGHGAVRYTGTAVSTVGSHTAPVVIHIDEFTTDQDMQRLAQALTEKGPAGLRDAAFELDQGWVRIGDSLGFPIAVAVRKPTPEGEKVTIVVDRYVDFFEIWHHLRSADYPFTYIEMTLGRDGKGQGELQPLAKVRLLPGGKLDVEGLAVPPMKLLNVQRR
jgi:hypothetical protein